MAEQTTEIEVSVTRVFYPPETTEGATWFILGTDQGACKGNMGWRPRPGERLKLRGKYDMYQGKREFKFTSAALNIPTDSRGMLHYVCEMASGIGSAMEIQIWEAKGEQWAALQPGDIPRMAGRVYENFIKAIEQAEADRAKGETIAKLLEAGATMNLATAAYEKWGEGTLGVIASNPFHLAELPHYGFKDVDKDIRHYYGIEDGDLRRIKAAIIYRLRQITGSGSTLVNWNELHKACLEMLGGYDNLIVGSVRDMMSDGTLKGFAGTRSVALASDYKHETGIWNYIAEDIGL